MKLLLLLMAITVNGAIASIEEEAPSNLKMKIVTDGGLVTVYLGPVVSMDHDQLPFRSGDRVEVSGSFEEIDGERVLVAKSLKRGHYRMQLQDGEWIGQ